MKVCPNSECPVYLRRRFEDDDMTCPRCGTTLLDPELAGIPDPTAHGWRRPVVTRTTVVANSAFASEIGLLGAVGTLLLAFVIVALLLALGRSTGMVRPGLALGGASTPTFIAPTSALPTPAAPVPAAQTQAAATAIAAATFAAQPTPIGGGIRVTPIPAGTIGAQPPGAATATLPPGIGGVNSLNPGAPPGLPAPTAISGTVVATTLCQRIGPALPCTPVTGYSPTDMFYLAVEANFGPAVRTIRVRLFGPPNGETLLIAQDQTNTPGRDGRYWVGFAFSQDHPWTVGNYRADIFVNSDVQRTTFVSWTVQ